jgi:hydrogenase nickel incorporation protein HypA/HybF
VLEEASKHNAKRVTSVHLIIGKLTFLGLDQIKFSYRLLVKGTIMEHSKLLIQQMDPTVKCSSCGYEGPAKYIDDPAFHFAIPTLTCPKCGEQVTIKLGRECTVKNIRIVTNGESSDTRDREGGE